MAIRTFLEKLDFLIVETRKTIEYSKTLIAESKRMIAWTKEPKHSKEPDGH